MHKIKVCYVCSSFPPLSCGVGDHVAEIQKELNDLTGLEVHVVTSAGIGAASSARVHPIVNKWNLKGWLDIHRFIQQHDFDCIHFEYPSRYLKRTKSWYIKFLPLTLMFSILNHLNQKKIHRIITIHEYYRTNKLVRLKIFLDSLLSKKILTVTPIDFQTLQKFHRLRNKLRFMPVGSNIFVDPKCVNNPGTFLKNKESTIRIGFFGFLTPESGFKDIIASAKILKTKGRPFIFEIMGGVWNKNYIDEIKQEIHSKGMSDNFKWHGFLDDQSLCKLLGKCSSVVLPYPNGANTNRSSLIVCLKVGIPIITTHIPDITPDIFVHEKNMLLMTPGDFYGISEAILRLEDDINLRWTIDKGMRDLSSVFSWKEAAKIAKDVYLSLVVK